MNKNPQVHNLVIKRLQPQKQSNISKNNLNSLLQEKPKQAPLAMSFWDKPKAKNADLFGQFTNDEKLNLKMLQTKSAFQDSDFTPKRVQSA